MSLLLALVSVCSPSVWSNNIGMSKAMCPTVLKMVPLGKIHLATPASELYNIHDVLTPKADPQHNNQTSKTFLRGNRHGDSRQRGKDLMANDTFLELTNLFPPSQNSIGKESFVDNGFLYQSDPKLDGRLREPSPSTAASAVEPVVLQTVRTGG